MKRKGIENQGIKSIKKIVNRRNWEGEDGEVVHRDAEWGKDLQVQIL